LIVRVFVSPVVVPSSLALVVEKVPVSLYIPASAAVKSIWRVQDAPGLRLAKDQVTVWPVVVAGPQSGFVLVGVKSLGNVSEKLMPDAASVLPALLVRVTVNTSAGSTERSIEVDAADSEALTFAYGGNGVA
jgi:hypothetical protein